MKTKRRKHQNRHHLCPRSKGGQGVESNLLWIDIERHRAWHAVFGNLTLNEVIALLIRVKQAKEAQKVSAKL